MQTQQPAEKVCRYHCYNSVQILLNCFKNYTMVCGKVLIRVEKHTNSTGKDTVERQ